jgi:hypothetical protein
MSNDRKTILYIQQCILEYARAARDTGPSPDHERTEPFISNGLVFIHQPSFRKWIGERHHFYVSQPQAMMALASLKAQPRLLNFKNKFGRKVYGINLSEEQDVRRMA